MEVDRVKSAAEDRMEMVMMMMQMEKLPEFYGDYNDVELPQTELADHASKSTSSGIGSSGSFSRFSSATATISFNGSTPVQEPEGPSFLFNPVGESLPSSAVNVCSTSSRRNNSVAAMREMIFRIAAMQPVHIDPESVKPPKRRNVKISKDPQSVAARHRRERISERIRILQRLVPGGTKMDTASMLDEAIHYVKFLKTQVQSLERASANRPAGIGFSVPMSIASFLPVEKPYQPDQNLEEFGDGIIK